MAQNKALVSALKEYALPLKTTEPLQPMDELHFLKDYLKDKSVISLGEATHGTKEFFQMKHRILRYLVEEMGYRVFVMEANQPECMAINDYIMYGKGDPAKALMGIYFWTWNTNEVLDIIKWMKNYNIDKADADKVKFYGCDMQTAKVAAELVAKELDRLQIDYNRFQYLLDTLSKSETKLYLRDSTELVRLQHQATELYEYVDEYKAAFISKTDTRVFEQHRQHIAILLQALTLRAYDNSQYRDSCMAINIKWISEHEHTDKIAVWAHNGHISKTTIYNGRSGYQMGYWIEQLFPNKYYAIGFDFHEGGFRAMQDPTLSEKRGEKRQVVNCTIKKTVSKSTDNVYHKVNADIFYLDYKKASEHPLIQTFLSSPINTKIIGAIFEPKWEKSYYHLITPKEYYDATIFVNTTTAAVPTKYYNDYVAKKRQEAND